MPTGGKNANLGTQFVTKARTALSTVGKALRAAFSALFSVLQAAISKLLKPIVAPIRPASLLTRRGSDTPLNLSLTQYQASHTVAPSTVNQFWTALDGPVLYLCVARGVGVSVALTLLVPFDFGPMFLLGIVVSLLAVGLSHYIGSIPAIQSFSATSIRVTQDFLNNTTHVSASIFTSLATRFTLSILALGFQRKWDCPLERDGGCRPERAGPGRTGDAGRHPAPRQRRGRGRLHHPRPPRPAGKKPGDPAGSGLAGLRQSTIGRRPARGRPRTVGGRPTGERTRRNLAGHPAAAHAHSRMGHPDRLATPRAASSLGPVTGRFPGCCLVQSETAPVRAPTLNSW